MKFGYTIFYVPDVVRTIEFFEAALGLERGYIAETKEYGELKTGDTVLSFVTETLATDHGLELRLNRPEERPIAAEVAFVTDDVDAAYAKAVAAGGVAFKAPEQKPWGQRVAYIREPNGILVELCTAVGQ